MDFCKTFVVKAHDGLPRRKLGFLLAMTFLRGTLESVCNDKLSVNCLHLDRRQGQGL